MRTASSGVVRRKREPVTVPAPPWKVRVAVTWLLWEPAGVWILAAAEPFEDEGVALFFEADGGLLHVAGEDDGVVGKEEESFADGAHFLVEVAAGEVGSADGAAEEGIAAKEHAFFGVVGDGAGGVAGGGDGVEAEAIDFDDVAVGDEGVGVGRALFDGDAEAGGDGFPAVAEEVEVGLVEEEFGAGGGVNSGDAHDVVDVGVGVGDVLDADAHVAGEREDFFGLVARVDADGFAGAAVSDDPAVFLEHADDDAADHEFVGYFHRRRVLRRRPMCVGWNWTACDKGVWTGRRWRP